MTKHVSRKKFSRKRFSGKRFPENVFWKTFSGKRFPENVFQKTFSGKRFPEKRFLENFFRETCLVTKRVAVGATEIIPSYFCAIFQADAEFEVKSAVASYFWAAVGHFLGQNFGHNFCFFWVCGNKRETPDAF